MAKTKSTTPKEKVVKTTVKKSAKPAVVTPKNVDKVIGDTKKAVEKAINSPMAEEITKTEPTLKLTVKYNNQTFTTETSDISSSLLELKPQHLKTVVYIMAEYNGKKHERHLFITQAKQLFHNEVLTQVIAKQIKTILNVI